MIDRAGMKQEPYLNHQPFGQMPYLVDEEAGIEIFESRAICKCVYPLIPPPRIQLIKEIRRRGQGRVPTPSDNDLAAFAKFEMACAFESADFDGPATGIWVELWQKMC